MFYKIREKIKKSKLYLLKKYFIFIGIVLILFNIFDSKITEIIKAKPQLFIGNIGIILLGILIISLKKLEIDTEKKRIEDNEKYIKSKKDYYISKNHELLRKINLMDNGKLLYFVFGASITIIFLCMFFKNQKEIIDLMCGSIGVTFLLAIFIITGAIKNYKNEIERNDFELCFIEDNKNNLFFKETDKQFFILNRKFIKDSINSNLFQKNIIFLAGIIFLILGIIMAGYIVYISKSATEIATGIGAVAALISSSVSIFFFKMYNKIEENNSNNMKNLNLNEHSIYLLKTIITDIKEESEREKLKIKLAESIMKKLD